MTMTDLDRVEASSLRRSKLDITVVRSNGVAQCRIDGEYLVIVHATAAFVETGTVGVELTLRHLGPRCRRLLENEGDVHVIHDVAVTSP
uniref:Uncharacterized protein n=1 Tax=Oryza rufipogon TaxID=4529 RepID=A0A0E0R7A4_ORYRU